MRGGIIFHRGEVIAQMFDGKCFSRACIGDTGLRELFPGISIGSYGSSPPPHISCGSPKIVRRNREEDVLYRVAADLGGSPDVPEPAVGLAVGLGMSRRISFGVLAPIN